MKTIYDLGMEITKLREAFNSIEVKGEQNASYVLYGIKKCNEIIQVLNNVAEQEKERENQNGSEPVESEVDIDGDSD